jgi:uncharacterized membrane protein
LTGAAVGAAAGAVQGAVESGSKAVGIREETERKIESNKEEGSEKREN